MNAVAPIKYSIELLVLQLTNVQPRYYLLRALQVAATG